MNDVESLSPEGWMRRSVGLLVHVVADEDAGEEREEVRRDDDEDDAPFAHPLLLLALDLLVGLRRRRLLAGMEEHLYVAPGFEIAPAVRRKRHADLLVSVFDLRRIDARAGDEGAHAVTDVQLPSPLWISVEEGVGAGPAMMSAGELDVAPS